MIMVIETLKCEGQCLDLMHALAMSINFLRYAMFLTHLLKCLHDNLFSPRVDELLYLAIALVNFSSKKKLYFVTGLSTIF